MSQSEQINELAAALAIVQGHITGARKDSDNPFFKSKYADLASVWDACRKPLSENGLAVIQTTEENDNGITVRTTLAHKSGQYISGALTMQPKDGSPQAFGSCLTYARRYALAAIVGVAQVDDDANAASQPQKVWTRDDTKEVTKYRERIMQMVDKDNDDGLWGVWTEMKGDHDFATAVWATLPKPVKSKISDLKAIKEPAIVDKEAAA